MAIAFVQDGTAITASGNPLTASLTFGSAVTAGNALLVGINHVSGTRTFTVTDDVMGSTGWVKTADPLGTAPGPEIWYNESHTGGTVTITVTHGFSSGTFHAAAVEFSGFGTITEDAQDNLLESVNSDSHTSSTSGVTSANPVLAFVVGFLNATATSTAVGSGYTRLPAAATSGQHLYQWQLFPSGCTSEVGAWTSAGTDCVANSVIVLLSGAAGANTTLTPSVGGQTVTGQAGTVTLNQWGRPNADVSQGGWVTSSLGGTLEEHINEATPNDANYIRSGASPTGDTAIVALGPLQTPQAGTITLRIRVRHV